MVVYCLIGNGVILIGISDTAEQLRVNRLHKTTNQEKRTLKIEITRTLSI